MRAFSSRGVRPSVTLVPALLLLVCGCRSSDANKEVKELSESGSRAVDSPAEERAAGPAAAQAPAFEPTRFEAVEGIRVRGALSGLSGRFSSAPAIVASPCGFYVIVGEGPSPAQALLLGRRLAWTEAGADQLLSVDGVVLSVGLADARTMGGPDARGEALLNLYGQWELAWLSKETGQDHLPAKENAAGTAHAAPHPGWKVWSSTLKEPLPIGTRPTSHVIVGSLALADRVLVLRALLPDEQRAMGALRRIVFAVDSVEPSSAPIPREDFLSALEKRVAQDPECSELHDSYGRELDLDPSGSATASPASATPRGPVSAP